MMAAIQAINVAANNMMTAGSRRAIMMPVSNGTVSNHGEMWNTLFSPSAKVSDWLPPTVSCIKPATVNMMSPATKAGVVVYII